MKKTLTIAAALLGGVLLAQPSSASPLNATASSALALADGGNNLVETVQYRRYGGYRGGPRYGYGGGYRGNRGAAIGAGIAAGAIGALAAGALVAQPRYYEPAPVYGGYYAAPAYAAPAYGAPAYADADAVAYCSRRFRTYDPSTGTYIANGGIVTACP